MTAMLILAETLAYDLILYIGLTLLVGLFFGRVFEHFNIPNLTGYIVLGLGIGALVLVTGQEALVETFQIVTAIAIGFIAFSIGMELDFTKIKNRRKEVVIITLTQAFFAFMVTALGMWLFGLPLHIGLVLGAIAIATEPGPILLITKKYKTHGPLTDTLVPLHGVEDMISILFFGLAVAFAVSVESASGLSPEMVSSPFLELIFSFAIGIIIGLIFRQIIKITSYDDPDKDTIVMVSALVAILISVAIANRGFEINHFHIHLSPILLPMVVGITFANTSTYKAKHEIEHTVDLIESPLMIAFFAVIGAEIVILVAEQLLVMEWFNLIIYTAVYVGFRVVGKLFGSWLGARMAHSDPVIQKYLGLCLLPQAQAAIGLAFIAQGLLSFTPYGNLILVITLVATVVYELFAPIGLRFALVRCNEADDAVCSLLDQQHKKPFFNFGKAH